MKRRRRLASASSEARDGASAFGFTAPALLAGAGCGRGDEEEEDDERAGLCSNGTIPERDAPFTITVPEVGVIGCLPFMWPFISSCDTGLGVLRSLSARLGSTTLASGMLTGSLQGCTVLKGIRTGRLTIPSPPGPAGLLLTRSGGLGVARCDTSDAAGEAPRSVAATGGGETSPSFTTSAL